MDEICERPVPTPEPPPPCDDDVDCTLNGSADGRECVEGVCGFAACTLDLECGARLCDDGRCAERVPCFEDGDCADGSICADGECRTPCAVDDECALAGLPLAACVDGECAQRCLGDVMCLGAICEENLCVDPQCDIDEDCTGPGSYFCDGGRCTQYTPCDEDDDCRNVNFRCNDLGRCEERPLCRVDADCGAGLCLDAHCRDAVPCVDDDACADDEDCVAGRCTDAPACRTSAECDPGTVCDGARCVATPALEDAHVLLADYGLGACASVRVDDADGPDVGVCTAVLYVGETFTFRLQAHAADGTPVISSVTPTLATDVLGAGGITEDTDGIHLHAEAASEGALLLRAGAIELSIALTFVEDTAASCDVLVIDGSSGAPHAAAEVACGDAAPVFSDLHGQAGATPLQSAGGVRVRSTDGRGVALLTDAAEAWRVVLPAATVSTSSAAGVRATIASNGNQTGPVGLSFALPSLPRAQDASVAGLFGEPFVAALDVPLLGTAPVVLPAAVVLSGSLPLGAEQDVKPEAFVRLAAGAQQVLAFEGRFETDVLLQLALGGGGDPVDFALDLAAQAEGDDARLLPAGVLAALPLVVDGDLADGVEDIDGDGDVNELVPDWAQFGALSVTPDQGPPVRTGLFVGEPPAGARARMLATCGVQTVGSFIPLGVAAVFGGIESPERTGEQLRAVAAGAALADAPRVCAVHGVFDDPTLQSVALSRSDGLPARVEPGAMLAPPAGAFVLADVPNVGDHVVVLPDASGDVVQVTVFDGGTLWSVVAGVAGSVALPPEVVPVVLAGTSVARVAGDPFVGFRRGERPAASVLERADAVAAAP